MAGKHHGDRTSPVVTIPPGQFGGSELRCSPYLNSEEEVQWHVDEPIEEGDPVTGGHHGRPFPMDPSRKFLGDDSGVKNTCSVFGSIGIGQCWRSHRDITTKDEIQCYETRSIWMISH